MIFVVVIVILVALPYAAAAFTGNFLFWYEAINNPCKEIGTPKPGPALCAGMLIRTLAGYVMAIACHPLGWIPRKKLTPWTPDGSLKHPPVVLIHGIYHNPSAWLLHERKLEKAGYVVSNFAYHSFFMPLEAILQRFDDHLHLLEVAYPGKKPILVGHSMGGVIIRKWLGTKKNAARISGVITLATPHGGSKLAALAPGDLVKTIAPSGALIKELKKAETPGELPCVSFVSPVDEIVLPCQCLIPPKGWKMRVTENVSHFGILLRSSVMRQMLEEMALMEQAARVREASPGPAGPARPNASPKPKAPPRERKSVPAKRTPPDRKPEDHKP